MGKKKSLMRRNIKILKSREKKFDHFGDYFVMYATLFGLIANFFKEYTSVGSKKTGYMLIVAMILEIMYIMAISLKITSHYSVKKYISDYKREVNILDLEVPNSSDFNNLINRSLAHKKLKSMIIFVVLVIVSVILFSLVVIIKFSSLTSLTRIFIVLGYMGFVFPILYILYANSLLQYSLLIYVYMGKSKDSES